MPTNYVEGTGRVVQQLDNLARRSRGAAAKAVSETTRRVQLGIRREVNAIFSKNQRAGNAVRSVVYDNAGNDFSSRGVDARGIIYSKFGRRSGGALSAMTGGGFIDYLGPYLTGRDILPRQGKYLAIPLQPGKRNRRPQPEMKLEPVTTGGRLYLVKKTRSRTLFMFLLVRKSRIRQRLRLAPILRPARMTLSAEMMDGFRAAARGAVR